MGPDIQCSYHLPPYLKEVVSRVQTLFSFIAEQGLAM